MINKRFNPLFSIVILPLLMLLKGCNSEGAFFDSIVKLERIDIVASPITTRGGEELTLAKDNQQPFEVTGHDSDGVTSNHIVDVCSNFAGPCIDFFDTGNGKLFTNSPSVAYLDSIGGSAINGILTENGTYGPAGYFYLFNWNNANALCDTYNINSLGGRTNWRLATRDELYNTYDNMFTARGWPTYYYYWSVTRNGSYYYRVRLDDGIISSSIPSSTGYASCVSNP